jgi:CHASE1-domain containing sensor protein
MAANEWAALAVAITTLIGTLAIAVRHLVKYYLSELRQNGGSSIKDQVNRLEQKVDTLYQILIQK